MNLSKIAIGAGVLIFSWFLVVVFIGGCPLGVATGVKGVYCSLWELLMLVVFSKPHEIEISHFRKCTPDKKMTC